jgi:hypothetical protein
MLIFQKNYSFKKILFINTKLDIKTHYYNNKYKEYLLYNKVPRKWILDFIPDKVIVGLKIL